MKTILYATDYSDNSVAALKYSKFLAERLNYRLVVCHVFKYPTILGSTVLSEPFPKLEKNAFKTHRTKLEDFCKEHLEPGWKGPNVQLQPVENKSVMNGILSTAEEWHAQMVVAGMKGENVLKEIIIGSTTKNLIEKAPCPILAIPEDAGQVPLKTIVYATAFEEEDVYAIRKLTELAQVFKAEIQVVHIVTEDEYEGETQMEWFKDMLQEKVNYEEIEFKYMFSDNILHSLRLYLDDVEADMVVMLEREHKGIFKKWFHGDLVKKMESYSKVPLLSFREGNHQLFYFSAVL
ncbi:universal stress protein [Maribacter aestuarii]|uniref:universal stress protein n=1 Tax=Maribacter aestuarii TaxID=1130723 RepID=UPI0025A4F5AA|nr:universal stress protein [Maribacter aestuarii]